MNTTTRVRLAAAAAVVGTAATGVPLAASHGGAAEAATTQHTLHFTSYMLKGAPLGGGFAGTDRLMRDGKVVGFDVVRGSIDKSGTVHLRGAAALSGGILYLTGTVSGSDGTGRVTGGTGEFAGATGTITDHIVDPDRGIVRSTVVWSS